MKPTLPLFAKRLIALALVLPFSLSLAYGQERATTHSGTQVILYPDGTWQYAPDGTAGMAQELAGIEIILHEEIRFVIMEGDLVSFGLLHDRNRHCDSFSGRLYRLGHYDVKYDIMTDRLSQVGPYKIEYDFMTHRVKQIGDYRIRYEFDTGRIKEVGNTRIKYSFFTGKVSEIEGETEGLRIAIF